jgi:predicted CoA-substrate-specific enzyme activase
VNRRHVEAALDIGSTSIKAVAVDSDESLLCALYQPVRGQLHTCLRSLLRSLQDGLQGRRCLLTAVTGSSATVYAQTLEVAEINEVIAAALGSSWLLPEAGAVLEIGGEHSKFIRLDCSGENVGPVLKDFHINSVCSAGTGAFLEQEAHRLNLSIEEFSQRACHAANGVRVAGRCAVFAKTDIVHMHQNGVPLDDITYTLCLAIARNITTALVGNRKYRTPLAFIGGVAANQGMRRAVTESLGLSDGGLVVPVHHPFADAIGALLAARKGPEEPERTLDQASAWLEHMGFARPVARRDLRPLRRSEGATAGPSRAGHHTRAGSGGRRGLLGIDIGSTTTNIALVTPDGRVADHVTLPTQGQALSAVRMCLERLEERNGELAPRGVGVTGSGRRFVSEIIGADLVINEITAHAAGGTHFYPDTESIFDIGGQDSKFIQLSDGAVTDFEMNKVCAAGTGSFIEEMSELLGLDIVGEFEREALRSRAPSDLGERCTVFMSSELLRRQREGSRREDLAAGLCYSIVHNYLSRVVGRHPIGNEIVFQGGVANNASVVAAMENVTGKQIRVHPYNEVAGAVGVALLAGHHHKGPSGFRGLCDLDPGGIRSRWFECRKCENLCTIHLTSSSSGRRFFSGGLCDRYEGRNADEIREGADSGLDLFAERDRAMSRDAVPLDGGSGDVIGIPRALLLFDMFPFWCTFFTSLGIPHRFSEPTTRQTLARGAALCNANTCLPLKIAYGHCADLVHQGMRRLFVPSVANLCFRTARERLDHLCPIVQGWPFTAKTLFPNDVEFLTPRLRFSIPHLIRRDMVHLGRILGRSKRRTLAAFESALSKQEAFQNEMLSRGAEVLRDRDDDRTYVAVLARPYTICEPTVNLRFKRALDELDMVAIPMDMLADEPSGSEALSGMYWYYGKRLLQTARSLRKSAILPVISLSNFGCGPDSFIIQMLRRELRNVPLLELEVDEHTDFTGIHTRLEAFKHSVRARRSKTAVSATPPREVPRETLAGRRLMIPYMSEHAFAFSGAFQSCGVDACVMPLPNEESLSRGKLALGGNECLPCAFLIGDMLRHLENVGEDDTPPAFFMISGDGPCRLGQYPWLQRVVLDERGYEDVPIFNASQDPAFYEKFGSLPAAFKRRAWQGTVATDLLFRKWRESRARAADRTCADELYREVVAKIERSIASGGPVRVVLEAAFERFDQLPKRAAAPAVTIAVLGENYIRCNPVANDRLAEILEDLGAEVWLPSLCEWIYYTNWTARLHCRQEKRPLRYLQLLAIDALQRFDQATIERVARNRLHNNQRPRLSRVFRLAAKYVPKTFEGETIVGIGRTLDLHERGVGGVIHVAPFGCMVGGIVETLGERISEDLEGFPILTVQYDGQGSALTRSKLEGFVHRAKAWENGTRENAMAGSR